MRDVGVKGIHIAERDTQRATHPEADATSSSTPGRSRASSREGMQPAELGWGTHERWMPANAGTPRRPAAARRSTCCSPAPTRACAPGARRPGRNTASSSPTTSRSRSPTTSRCARAARSVYRPTCHYAYHPCNDAVLSLHEMFGQAGRVPGAAPHPRRGRDRRRHRRARRAALRPRQERLLVRLAALDRGDAPLAPYQNATGLQVTSAVLAGMVWALENPQAGIVEADEMDFRRCLEVQTALSRPGRRRLHRLDAARPAARASSPRTSTRATPGSSATCWCGSFARPHAGREVTKYHAFL